MMQPTLVQTMRLSAVALAVAAVLFPDAAGARVPMRTPVSTAGPVHARHTLGSSLVRCTLLRQRGRAAGSHHAAPVFAPTSQAVFFAHAGDRCIWHAGTAVRG